VSPGSLGADLVGGEQLGELSAALPLQTPDLLETTSASAIVSST
jgi:hypothetical protein